MPSPIIARADALMHRKRQSGGELNEVPVLTDAIDEDDDIPLLTDIDGAFEPERQAVTVIAAEAGGHRESEIAIAVIDPAWREQMAHELARRVEERLRAALPQIISSTVKDFLAEQEMIANS